jgi:uncharacterized protein YndB with AHSA1/START domain
MTKNKEKFVYTTYIASTPANVWKALLEGELTRQYWKHTNESDWKPGSRWKHVADDGKGTVKLVGQVIEVIPNKRLVFTWADVAAAADTSRHSRVTIDIEKVGDMVRLTVTHDELEAGSNEAERFAAGWPRVLSSLKSFLETGRPLDTWA